MKEKKSFDVLGYLLNIKIPFKILEDWIYIRCPFCSDPEKHLGIYFKGKNNFHCWICGKLGDILSLVQELKNGILI